MRVLLACGDYSTISGAPMFVHGLAVQLQQNGHYVHIAAPNVNGVMADRTRELGIQVTNYDNLHREAFDVAHVNGIHASHWAVSTLDRVPILATVHSTLIYETPLVHDRISHYACVRPQIMEKVIRDDGVPSRKTSVVWNGIDRERFKPGGEKFDRPTVLFAGTVDYLRAQATGMVLDLAEERDWRVLFVGRKLSGQLDNLPSHARYFEGDIWEIETLLQQCTATAGILLGRTTIEGWACGLPGIIYEIDNDGNVMDWGEHPPPPWQVMAVFDVRFMTDMYEKLYERIQ